MNKKVILEVSPNHVNTILAALSELPYRTVASLLASLSQQASAQLTDENASNEPSAED